MQQREPDPSNEEMIEVDGRKVSVRSLYGDIDPVVLRPIGVVVSNKDGGEEDLSQIRLHAGLAQFMKGLVDENRLTIVWHFHEARSLLTVHHRRIDGKEVGPFASRTPVRPTPVAVTDVDLVEVKGTTLVVRGLDAAGGSPVLDIKVAMGSAGS